jgi:integrase
MWGTLVWVVMTTGIRRGEALALRWRHVHFDRQVLEIRRNYIQRRGRKIEKDTKTHQMRRIALDPDTITVLTEHRDRALHRAALLEVACIDDWYLFSHDPAHSQPLNPDWVTHRYTAMAAGQGITTHLHELRHYSATELLSAGVDLATVSGRLGHGGGGATTLRVYAAWVAASDQRAAEILGAKMPPRPSQPDKAPPFRDRG